MSKKTKPTPRKKITTPLFSSKVSAGFPSPADDFIEANIDLNKLLVHNAPATYLVRVQGDSMADASISDGDILVVNASLRPQSGDIVVAAVDGEFLVKRYSVQKNKTYLVAENKNFKPLLINPDDDFTIFGVVTGLVREIKKL